MTDQSVNDGLWLSLTDLAQGARRLQAGDLAEPGEVEGPRRHHPDPDGEAGRC